MSKLDSKEYRDSYVRSNTYCWLAYQIRALRKQRGWTQEQLAEKAGVNAWTIGKLESPDNENIRMSTLIKLASAFDIAFMAQFVGFQELMEARSNLTPRAMRVDSYAKEGELTEAEAQRMAAE